MAKETINIDIENYTLGEMETLEDITGLPMSELFKEEFVLDANGRKVPDPDDEKGRPLKEVRVSMKSMIALVYITRKRENPEYTLEDARNIRLSDLDIVVESPTEASEEGDPALNDETLSEHDGLAND